eukprot:359814-Chlamydomonas_euryale.AAC.4
MGQQQIDRNSDLCRQGVDRRAAADRQKQRLLSPKNRHKVDRNKGLCRQRINRRPSAIPGGISPGARMFFAVWQPTRITRSGPVILGPKRTIK